MKKMKQRMYLAFVALLWSAAALFGCGGSDTVNATQRNSKFLYAVNSDDATVSGFTINAGSGVLAPVGMAVATGAIPQYPAATKDGKFLYVANDSPTASSVSGYRINSRSVTCP